MLNVFHGFSPSPRMSRGNLLSNSKSFPVSLARPHRGLCQASATKHTSPPFRLSSANLNPLLPVPLGTISKRTAASHPSRDSMFDLRCCQSASLGGLLPLEL